MNTYRVWMKDGYAGLENAETEQQAREQAIENARRNTEELAMSEREKRLAVTVDRCEQLNS